MDCSPPGSSAHGTLSGKNTGVGCHFLLQGALPNPGIEPSSPGLLHWQADSLPVSRLESPVYIMCQFNSVQFSLSGMSDPMDCSTPGFPVHHQLPEPIQTHVYWVNDAIQPSHLLSSPSPPAFNLSQHQGLFQRVSSSHQVAKYWSFSFSISPSNECSALISFRVDWFDLLAAQGTLKSLLQHHSSKASILQHSAFFMVQLSHPYTTPGKTTALTWLSKVWLSDNCL